MPFYLFISIAEISGPVSAKLLRMVRTVVEKLFLFKGHFEIHCQLLRQLSV